MYKKGGQRFGFDEKLQAKHQNNSEVGKISSKKDMIATLSTYVFF